MNSKNKNEPLTVEKLAISALGVYVFVVSATQLSKISIFWPLSLYILLCAFSVYAIVLANKRRLDRSSKVYILVEAFLATALIFPKALGLAADAFGVKCENLLGGAVKCSDSVMFATVELAAIVLIPMLIIATFFIYVRSNKLILT